MTYGSEHIHKSLVLYFEKLFLLCNGKWMSKTSHTVIINTIEDSFESYCLEIGG